VRGVRWRNVAADIDPDCSRCSIVDLTRISRGGGRLLPVEGVLFFSVVCAIHYAGVAESSQKLVVAAVDAASVGRAGVEDPADETSGANSFAKDLTQAFVVHG
jgi:hypothetical protein